MAGKQRESSVGTVDAPVRGDSGLARSGVAEGDRGTRLRILF